MLASGRPTTANCTWLTFAQRVDHFGAKETGTFEQRYCRYDRWWNNNGTGAFDRAAPKAPGPIFFYTGNESPVEEYVNNTGLMWELGEQLGALLVFAEHRYEPLSHPALCGNGTQTCISFCTTAQALADWVALITHLRGQHAARAPVIAFGGSYGGMLAGWLRMKYPSVVDGAIAASAPIWQLASTVRRESLDAPSVAISRGVSAAGGATDRCRENLRAAWPLLHEVGASAAGLHLLSRSFKTCKPVRDVDSLLEWAQAAFFLLAEGDYPFESDYITFSVGPGLHPLPPWPMRVACAGLDHDFGIRSAGSFRDVRYTLHLGALDVVVDWANITSNAAHLTTAQIETSGVLDLAAAVVSAVGVWYNVTHELPCFDIPSRPDSTLASAVATSHADGWTPNEGESNGTGQEARGQEAHHPSAALLASRSGSCPTCPPCDACPPCPISYCNWEDERPCDFHGAISKYFSWTGITCNDALSQIGIQGVGRDIFWPPSVTHRNYTVDSVVGPHRLRTPSYCAARLDREGLRGAPLVADAWSSWLTAYYGGRDEIAHHRNIVWSNGALDPWSGQGVYPPGGGADGPMVQNISADGSQIALVLDLGAHHLDLMFTDRRNPPCFYAARKVEERMIRQWCQEAYDAARTHPQNRQPSKTP